MALAEGSAEECLEDLTETAEAKVTEARSVSSLSAVQVIGPTLLGIAQALIRLVDLFELVLGTRFAVAVRVALKREPPERFAYVQVARVTAHAQNLVVVASYLHVISTPNHSFYPSLRLCDKLRTRVSHTPVSRGGGVSRCYNPAVNKSQVRAAVSGHQKQEITDGDWVQSAVLVPLLCKDEELHVLLTERTDDVRSHKGQVCFPGGATSRDDESLLATALRETWEETGLKPEDVEVIGELDDSVVHSTRYVITPFVGFVPYPYRFVISQLETKDIFFVPLRVLMDPLQFNRQERVISGHYYYGPVCDYDGHVIWGATGRILEHLVALLSEVSEPASR